MRVLHTEEPHGPADRDLRRRHRQGAGLTMIDRPYGHLARDGREHAIRLLDGLSTGAQNGDGR